MECKPLYNHVYIHTCKLACHSRKFHVASSLLLYCMQHPCITLTCSNRQPVSSLHVSSLAGVMTSHNVTTTQCFCGMRITCYIHLSPVKLPSVE